MGSWTSCGGHGSGGGERGGWARQEGFVPKVITSRGAEEGRSVGLSSAKVAATILHGGQLAGAFYPYTPFPGLNIAG
eukprot:6637946-Pyramimonas_sp.AAC.1